MQNNSRARDLRYAVVEQERKKKTLVLSELGANGNKKQLCGLKIKTKQSKPTPLSIVQLQQRSNELAQRRLLCFFLPISQSR